MKLHCIYSSYEKTELEIRERIAFNQDELIEFLKFLKKENFADEFFIISSCNRTEIYYLSDQNLKERFINLLSIFKNDASIPKLPSIFQILGSTDKVVDRLFKVSNGVLSQVLGDLQIIGQMKEAYKIACQLKCTGPVLHKLLQSVFTCYKEVATSTKLHSGSASISYTAMELTRDFLHKKKEYSILVIGAGKFSREIVAALQKKGFTNITITNRTFEKAQSIADQCNLQLIHFEDLDDTWCFDVVISCIGAGSYVINEDIFEINPTSHKLLIDLSVPRSINPAIGNRKGIKLFNISQIHEKNSIALKERENSLPQVREIIKKYTLEFIDFLKSNKSRPVIHQLKHMITEITQQEVNRHSKKIKSVDLEAAMIHEITQNIINKIVRTPARQLNTNKKEIDRLSEALIQLFELKKYKTTPQKQ